MKLPRIPLVQALLDLAGRERRALLAEVAQTKGLMPLLMKRRNGERWTRAERRELRAHLARVSRLSPYLFVLVMPGGFLLLPVLAWWLDRRRRPRTMPADAGARAQTDQS